MTEKFDKKLTNKILPRFAAAKEWPDLMTILKKFKDNLIKYKACNMGILTDKISLAKRLAQCLNQSLPSGVHEMDLDVYSILFDNIKLNNNNFMGDNLGLYSAGLFPFFIYASAKNKIKFLDDIIKKHYLTLEISEFKLSLSGMLASVLPALDEQNEVMQKSIREVFQTAREKCGDTYFFGTLWSIIFRNKKLRLDCMKYINEIIPAYNEMIDDERSKSELINDERSKSELIIDNNEDKDKDEDNDKENNEKESNENDEKESNENEEKENSEKDDKNEKESNENDIENKKESNENNEKENKENENNNNEKESKENNEKENENEIEKEKNENENNEENNNEENNSKEKENNDIKDEEKEKENSDNNIEIKQEEINNINEEVKKEENKKPKKIKLKRNEVIDKFYPNLSILVLNSLKELIVNSELHTQRLAMDFIISHFPIDNNIFSEEEKISLIKSGLQLLIKNDYSTSRRLLIWLLGQNQDEEIEMGEPNIQYMLVLLVKALKSMLKNSEKSKEDLLNNIKIIDQLLKQQVKFVDYILEPISIEIILVIQDYWDNYSKQEPKDEVIHKIKNFYIYDSGYLDLLWNSLGKKLNSINKNMLTKNVNNLNNIMIEFHSILKVLNFCLEYIYLDKIYSKIKYYIPIISSLLKSFPIFKIENMNDLYTIEPFLELTLKIVKSLQLGFNSKEEESISNYENESMLYDYNSDNNIQYNDAIYNEFLQNQIKFSSKKGNSLQYIVREGQQNSNIIHLFAENILSYQQKTYINICKVILDSQKKIFEKNENDNQNENEKDNVNENEEDNDENNANDLISDPDLSLEQIKIFKFSTELAILTQEYINANNYNFNFLTNTMDIPEWIFYLEKIIFSYNIDLSLEAINYLLDLFMVSSENIIYDNIKSYLRTEDIDESIVNEKFLSELLKQTHVSKNCLELSMSRLWGLIEDQSHQKPVADLLIKFFVADTNIFQNTISNTFAVNDIEQNVISIKNFSQFWKLTSEFYPEIIFFENGECIFKMLDFLEHEHPLIRHLSKSWLSEAKNQFRKIIDPLLKVLLDRDTKWYISFQKQLFFTKEYDNRRIIEAFRKLKNIIINVPEIAVGFFVEEKISQILLDMDEIGKELRSVTKTITMEYYLELLVTISLRFIQGKFIESISQQFYRENFSVNAASCEFLEFLLNFIEPKNKVMDIAQSIVEPVLDILQESLKTDDEVMQVQLINLLKALLISTANEHNNYKEQINMILNSNMFQNCIVNGIQINYIFVRGYFIHFVQSCLPVFKNVLTFNQNLNLAKKLILTTTDFLVSRVKYNIIQKKKINSNNTRKISENNENNNEINNGVNKEGKVNNDNDKIDKYDNYSSLYLNEGDNFFIVKNYLKEYKELKKLDENDLTVIIKGLKNIIFHFLDITEIQNNDIMKANQSQPNINGNTTFDWEIIKNIISSTNKGSFFTFFGFFSSSPTTNNNQNNNSNNININNNASNSIYNTSNNEEGTIENNNISNEDIIQKILDITEDVIAALLVCWINTSQTDQIKDYCLNEFGILSSDFDDVSFLENKNNQNILNIQSIQLKQLIIIILWNIYVKYPLEFMKNIIKIFMNENNKYIYKDKQYKLSIIEILSQMKIPTDIFILSISKNIDAEKIKNTKKTQNKFHGFYPYSLNKDQSIFEAKLCQLVYSYIIFGHYGISKTSTKVDSKICLDTWNEIINFVNLLFESKSSMTLYWLYEIINVTLYKFPIREMASANYLKKKIVYLIINLFNKIFEICINDNFESAYISPTQLITPLPPSVYQAISYELYTNKIGRIPTNAESVSRSKRNLNQNFVNELNKKIEKKIEKNKETKDAIRHFYENVKNHVENRQEIEPDQLIIIYRNIGFICLSSLFYSTMKTIITSEKMIPYFSAVVNGLFNIIKKYRSQSPKNNDNNDNSNNQNINLDNEIYVDLSTKFLHNLMKQAPSITYNSARDKIMEFYLDQDFFNMSSKNLSLWKDIISEFSRSYANIINALMDKINQGGGLFFSKNTDQLNIISMRRLSFIIYSCPKNTYALKLGQIMEKAKEVITKYCENPALLSEIFLMIRVMFLRFSNENLIELIRALWPIIFTELITILTGKRKNITNELNLGCAKLIELLTISNMEEFCLYQWIFFIDSYNVDDVDIRNDDNNSQLYYLLNTQNNCFKPFAFSIAKNWNKCMDFVNQFNSKNYELFQKRSLTLQLQKIMNEDELGSLIAKMFTYVAIMNNFRDVLDLDAIEKVIENDFLSCSI